MALVNYSDSEASDVEAPVPKAAASSTKPAFQKVVDRSNPGKIKVSLPQAAPKDKSGEPPTKRAKIGGGGLSGFNSFLPAPKNIGQAKNTTLGGGNTSKKGLGAGVSLKTGAAPGFSREPEPEREYTADSNEGYQERAFSSGAAGMSLPLSTSVQHDHQQPVEVKPVGKATMFRPLSVARKPAKKKKVFARSEQAAPATSTVPVPTTPVNHEKLAPRPKVSLFSISAETSNPTLPVSRGEYQPMMFEPADGGDGDASHSIDDDPSYEEYTPNHSNVAPPAVPTPPISQSLDDIAGDLNLSAAERRQLFGRQKGAKGAQAATKVINFNTDEEYLHNEEIRASGEQVVHNVVRSIAPGKHSLKQLVSAAQNQKEALEESFAKGRSNRAEASSRYGW